MRIRKVLFVALVSGSVLGCSSSPRTVTAAPRGWPVPPLGHVSALLPVQGGLLMVEDESVGVVPDRRISRIAAEGGLPSLVALGQPSLEGAPIVSGTDVLWVAGRPGQIRLAPVGGGAPPRVLVTAPDWIATPFAIDMSHVYFGRVERVPGTRDDWTRSLWRVPRAGGTPEALIESCPAECSPFGVADDVLYVQTSSSILAFSLRDRTSVELATGLRPGRALVEGDDVYVLEHSSSDVAADGALLVLPRAGGPARRLVTGLRHPVEGGGSFADFAIDPRRIVVLDRLHDPRPELVIIERASSQLEHRATHQREPSQLALDAHWIYLATLDDQGIERESLDR